MDNLDRAAKVEWVRRVLGVDVQPVALEVSDGTGDVRSIWLKAKQGVHFALAQLADRLKATDDPVVQDVARTILPKLTQQQDTIFEAVLADYETSSTERRPHAEDELRRASAAYRTALSSEEAFRLADENPLGIKVSLRKSLDQALADVEALLTANQSASAA